jgi:hypothetical protein
MAKENLMEQLQKLKEALGKWEKELEKYKNWALQNDGVLSDEEKKKSSVEKMTLPPFTTE